ncbi:1,4-dihydroxy-2-naphthoate polyprenyltransferase [Bogoriella caseilytica]|uniref:1,4-dihydroxy-2-naphthoate octaprenyltransferase n=1 Tax=Bogoriella caseilytica TaxID=56055 RepID=A0A3N2BAM7_9MICO|nr:1,4-dihydroxy-2-naphthoate polyprenyltransferase [Bogoriella caseilytica]ROR72330.1 1,4-dihydroxy-2-naphthoate prenyltransferase [Bogoriella caseilytica]
MATATEWIQGARLRTLPAALAPVLIGTGAALREGATLGVSVPRGLLAAGVAVALQVGVNYANDYSDGVRGTDDVRAGPMRLTATGKAAPGTVKRAAFASFAVAAALGLGLVAVSGTWWLLAVGALAVLAAWYYTGGARPYGYLGLGEVFVFVFFGLVATLGTTWTQSYTLPPTAWLGASGVGLLSCAILMANNLRDIPTDTLSGKRTLAVRLGERRARRAYVALVWTALALGGLCAFWAPTAVLFMAVLIPAALRLSTRALSTAQGRDLIPLLSGTGLLVLVYGIFLTIALIPPATF